MTLKEKQEEFDKEISEWAKKYQNDRIEFWRNKPIIIETNWDTLAEKVKREYLTPIFDGTFDAGRYGSENIKIVYIAKEPPFYDQDNYRTNTDYSLGEYWSWLQRIAAGMLRNEYAIDKIDPPKSNDEYKDMLCTSAWVNLQKFPATNTSDNDVLRKWYHDFEGKILLRKQLEILDPNILVFVGTGDILWGRKAYEHEWDDLVKKAFFNGQETENKSTDSKIGIYFTKDKLVLDCYHIKAWSCVTPEEWAQLILNAYKQWENFKLKLT
jgi:hypothetical protein